MVNHDTLLELVGLPTRAGRVGVRLAALVAAPSGDLLLIDGILNLSFYIPSRPSATARGGTRRPRLVEADSYTLE